MKQDNRAHQLIEKIALLWNTDSATVMDILSSQLDEQLNKELDVYPKPGELRTVIVQKWEETERDWGERPDGFSLHLSTSDALAYNSQFMEDQRRYFTQQGFVGVPSEYDRPVNAFMGDSCREIILEKSVWYELQEIRKQGKKGIRVRDINAEDQYGIAAGIKRITF